MNISKIHTTNSSLKTFLVLIAIISISLLSYPASAESGNISISTNVIKSYNQNFPNPNAADFTKIKFDTGDYNQIEQIFINTSGTGISYASTGKSTTFTITSCGSGGGTAAYSQTSTALAWYFTYPSTISCTPVILSYSTNIFTDITGTQSGLFSPDLNDPAYFDAGAGGVFTGGGAGRAQYQSVVDSVTTNHYNITYQSGTNQLFTTNITKVGYTTVNTKVIIENASGTPKNYSIQGDSTFNNNNFNVVNTYGQGIALNMSLSGGQFTRLVVNASGSTVVVPTPTPTPPPIPSGSDASIAFDKTNYSTGDTGYILVNSSQLSTFFGLYTYRVDFFSSTNPLISQFSVNMGQSENTFTASFPTQDTYTANLVKSNVIFGTDQVIGSDSAQALLTPGFLDAPNLVQVGKYFNVTYMFGVQPTFSHVNGIKTYYIDAGVPVEGTFFSIGNTTPGVLINYSIYLNNKGSYVLYLFDAGRGNVASKSIQADYFQNGNTSLNITSSNITILSPQPSNAYGFNDLMQVTFQTDNANWTNGSQQIMIDVYNVDSNTETITFPVQDQVGAFSFFLQNGYYKNSGFFASGSNNVRLIALSGNGANTITVLGYKNFTLSGLNDAGYGLTLDKYVACNNLLDAAPNGNQTVKITAVTPAPANFSILRTSYQGNYQVEFGQINGTRTLTRSFSTPGTYIIQLIRQSDNTIQQEAYLTINTCAALGITPTTPISKTEEMLSSGFFAAIIVMAAFLTIGYVIGGFMGAALGFGTGFIMDSVYNLVPTWSVILFAIIVITAFAVMAGKTIVGGGED